MAVALITGAITAAPRLHAAAGLVHDEQIEQEQDGGAGLSRLVEKVREATEPFRQSVPPGYQQFLGCVSGPEAGAMGVHFVNFELVDGKEPDAAKPEALIYEVENGRARLVGVEFIVPAEAWDAAHGNPATPPELEGQVFHFVASPNRFRLPAFYELHVWAWRDNPKGTFADFNPRVSCDRR
ncbi:MAG TPA: hypothetical protein VFK57_18680 [Vicinamibacterales bacterium]|nr:hypothetical protein [Vicinamibacterales bacterium]